MGCPSPYIPWGDAEVGPGGCCVLTGAVSQLRNPEFRKLLSFNGGASKPVQPLLCRRNTFIILVRKQISSDPEGNSVSSFPGYLFYKCYWKDSLEEKLSQDRIRRNWRSFSQVHAILQLLGNSKYKGLKKKKPHVSSQYKVENEEAG